MATLYKRKVTKHAKFNTFVLNVQSVAKVSENFAPLLDGMAAAFRTSDIGKLWQCTAMEGSSHGNINVGSDQRATKAQAGSSFAGHLPENHRRSWRVAHHAQSTRPG